MQLTKHDIQKIDDYLKNRNVKHWDIRIEMIDHIASEFEENQYAFFDINYIIKKYPYKKIKKIMDEKMKNTNSRIRKLFWFKTKSIFKKPKNILILSFVLLFEIWLLHFSFKKLVFGVLSVIIPYIFISILFSVKNYYKGNYSYNLERIFIEKVLIIAPLNLVIMLYKTEFKNFAIFLFIFYSMFVFIRLYVGYIIFKKNIKKYNLFFNDYKTINLN